MGIKTQIKAKDLESNNQFNISLLGFKMAITEGLTVFNLVDGIVDEFEDEGGTDASASTNLNYCGTNDYYINQSTPSVPYSAGFTTTTITEPDTSTAGTNPAIGSGVAGKFTVPSSLTSATAYLWGAGGGKGAPQTAGGGGFTTGTLAVTPGQILTVGVGETGDTATGGLWGGGSSGGAGGAGGGASFILTSCTSWPAVTAPGIAFVGAGGGGSGGCQPRVGGAGGGLTGHAGDTQTAQTSANSDAGGGGSQTVGGQAGSPAGTSGSFKTGGGGGAPIAGGGGGGYYGGGSGSVSPTDGSGGGGSSYYGHPQVTGGSTEDGAAGTGGGTANPNYVACTNNSGQDGYVLITGTTLGSPIVTSSTIISDPFTANTIPTTSRIVVFEENVGTPTLNTDVIASVSRNGGTNFTTVTLTDSGYVTGTSGQRILTGQADISGQPSGQSMKWKLQLANQTVKIHGVSLQWS